MEKHKVQIITVLITRPTSVLLFKTNKNRGSFWQNITGSVKKNESFLDAAQREYEEESGILLPIEQFKPIDRTISFTNNFTNYNEHIFLVTTQNEFNVTISSKEHCEYKWVSTFDAYKYYYYESNYNALLRSLIYV